MNRFVVRIGLRQHVPLCAGVEYPQYSFENTSGRDRLASRTSIGDVLFRKMIPDALPAARLLAESSDIYSRSTPPSNFEIGSSLACAPRSLASLLGNHHIIKLRYSA